MTNKKYNSIEEILEHSKNGDPDALYWVAECYYLSNRTIKNSHKKSLELFLQAANKGHSRSQKAAGDLYEEKGKIKQAIYWYMKYWKNPDTGTFNKTSIISTLAKIYYNGNPPIKRDYKKALRLYLYLAKNDKSDTRFTRKGHPSAKFIVASMYEKGQGTKVNMKKAKCWYNEAIKGKDINALIKFKKINAEDIKGCKKCRILY